MSGPSDKRGSRGTVPGFGEVPAEDPSTLFGDEPTVIERGLSDDGRRPHPTPVVFEAARVVGGDTREPLSGTVPVTSAAPPSTAMPATAESDARRPPKGPPAVDIDLVYERRSAPLPDQPWIFLEVWTRNTIYQLDASLVCIDVIAQGTRKTIPGHPLKGARLVGGQSRDGEAVELSHPFPRPGSEAVFEQATGRHVRFSQTSSVTRVVMRLRVLTVEPEQLLPTWEDVSGRWDPSTFQKV